jgi:hypothetical protein
MGLSFHYSGSISKPELLPELIDEVHDIARSQNWKPVLFGCKLPEEAFGKNKFNHEIYGIVFTPTECESVPICFLSNGRMSSPWHLSSFGNSEKKNEKDYLYLISVKTQYAGIEMHQFLIHFFRHLETKYLADFRLLDEGGYWESNDPEILKANFKKYTRLIDGFADALDTIPMLPGENTEEYLVRLMRLIERK